MAQMDGWRTSALQQYAVTRRYILHTGNSGSVAEMGVRVNYRYPGRKDFEILWSKGSSAVRDRVFRRLIETELQATRDQMRDQTRISPANYDFRLVGKDVQDGRPCYILELLPKVKSKFLVRGRIWVDAQDYAVARLEGTPAESASFWLRHLHMVQTYKKIGDFWLAAANHTDTDVRFFGPAQLKIECYDYTINAEPTREARASAR